MLGKSILIFTTGKEWLGGKMYTGLNENTENKEVIKVNNLKYQQSDI